MTYELKLKEYDFWNNVVSTKTEICPMCKNEMGLKRINYRSGSSRLLYCCSHCAYCKGARAIDGLMKKKGVCLTNKVYRYKKYMSRDKYIAKVEK